MLSLSHYFIRFNQKYDFWEIVDQYEQKVMGVYSSEEDAAHDLVIVEKHGTLPVNDPLES